MTDVEEEGGDMAYVAPEVAREIARWLTHLGAERRMSANTLEAYRRDVGQFLAFLAQHSRHTRWPRAARCPGFHGGTPKRGHRCSLFDARFGRQPLVRPLPRTRRQGQIVIGILRSFGRALPQDRENAAEAACGRPGQTCDRGRSAGR